MPKKKSGFPYEVYPTPAKGKDGGYIVYARPAKGRKLSIDAVDEYCAKYYQTRSGEIEWALKAFLKGAAELMAKGYRIDTPIGSFVPKLSLKREITDPDQVRNSDVQLDGVDYNPGKTWNKAIGKWLYDGFLRVDTPNVHEVLADPAHMEEVLRKCLQRGYTTVSLFASYAGLTKFSARKLLNAWTEGEPPKLLKSKMSCTCS